MLFNQKFTILFWICFLFFKLTFYLLVHDNSWVTSLKRLYIFEYCIRPDIKSSPQRTRDCCSDVSAPQNFQKLLERVWWIWRCSSHGPTRMTLSTAIEPSCGVLALNPKNSIYQVKGRSSFHQFSLLTWRINRGYQEQEVHRSALSAFSRSPASWKLGWMPRKTCVW